MSLHHPADNQPSGTIPVFDRADLNEEMQDLYDIVGHEAMGTILARFGGCMVYFPTGGRLGLTARDASIRAQFTGHNHKELARAFGLSVRHIRAILERGREASRQDVAA